MYMYCFTRLSTAGARLGIVKQGEEGLGHCTCTLNWRLPGRAPSPYRLEPVYRHQQAHYLRRLLRIDLAICFSLQDNVAFAARCKNLTNVRGQRAPATLSWQFEDQHSQLWSSVNLFHGLSAEQKSAIKTALTKRRFLPGETLE